MVIQRDVNYEKLVSLIFIFILLSSPAYVTHASSMSSKFHGNKQLFINFLLKENEVVGRPKF